MKLITFFRELFGWGDIRDASGRSWTQDDFDRLRGMHSGRAAEASRFSIEVRNKNLNNPRIEYYDPNHEPGAPAKVIPVAGLSASQIDEILKRRGNYYTGRVKTYFWKYRGVEYFNSLAEAVHMGDTFDRYVHMWQGFNQGPGYASSRKSFIIEGPDPKIMGVNFEPSHG